MGLRYYQQDAVNAVWQHLREKDTNPCVVMPTGSGKSWVIGQLAADAVKNWNGRVLCLAHVKELLEQNAEKIRAVCPDVKTGIYSAGLNSRQTSEPVIVGAFSRSMTRSPNLVRLTLLLSTRFIWSLPMARECIALFLIIS